MESISGFLAIVVAVIILFRRRFYRKVRRIRWSKPRLGDVIAGKAFVIDGDTIRVSKMTVRIAGIDAPEVDQKAKLQNGYWYNQGQHIKGKLIQMIGGKTVCVCVQGHDRYGRVLGTVTYNGEDVGEWLVRNGYAISAYGNQYKHVEREARKFRRGMWNHAEIYDPRAWRHR